MLGLTLLFLSPNVRGQRARGRRAATGAERASQVEKVLEALYPGATVGWDPDLAVRVGAGPPIPVQLRGFTAVRQRDGTVEGVTAVEAGTAKRDYIEKLKEFQAVRTQTFGTTIVVFRMDSSGNITAMKKLGLDPVQPITQIEWFSVQSWSAEGWPVLRLDYNSYISEGGSLAMLGWDSVFNTGTGSFVSRVPAGIIVKQKNGGQTGDMFTVRRSGPTEIQIVGNVTKKVINYSCGDPCVVDGPKLVTEWSQ